ncbi:MAG: GbsR/MarR family transcriptional regulator [Eubacteriales bacterium]
MNGRDDEGVRDRLIEAMGKQSAFWGLGKTTGEIYAVLYLSPGPVTLEEIAGHLQFTKGNVSLAVRNLERLGMVRRIWRKGDRKVYFESETDFWKITRTVLAQRQKPEFDDSFRLVEESLSMARDLPETELKTLMIGRLKNLQDFYEVIDRLAEALLKIKPEQIASLAGMISALPKDFCPGDALVPGSRD